MTLNGPDMALAKSHAQTFSQGSSGRMYRLVATNVGTSNSTGLVTVTDDLPAAFKATSISGAGWNCLLGTLTCTRTDALAAGASYPAITVKVDVKGNAPGTVSNRATVSRAGESAENDTDSDPTTIARARCDGVVATIVGSKRGQTIRGTNHRDVIAALGGADVVKARGGRDLVCGGSGADRLYGGRGHDRLLGGPGRDTLAQ